jgi:chromosome segregation ATPase
MYNAININPDSVEFEATVGGYNQIVNLERPDGVSYSQWSGLWSGFKELHDSRKDFHSYLEEIEERISEENGRGAEVDYNNGYEAGSEEVQRELDAAQDEIADLKQEIKDLEAELREVNYRLESLEK